MVHEEPVEAAARVQVQDNAVHRCLRQAPVLFACPYPAAGSTQRRGTAAPAPSSSTRIPRLAAAETPATAANRRSPPPPPPRVGW